MSIICPRCDSEMKSIKEEHTQENSGIIESCICECGIDFFHHSTLEPNYMLPLAGRDKSDNLIIINKCFNKKDNLELFLECSGDLQFARIGKITSGHLEGYVKLFNGDVVKEIIRMPIKVILDLILL